MAPRITTSDTQSPGAANSRPGVARDSRNSRRSTIAAVELFNPRTRAWRSLPSMRTPRHGLGGAVLGNRVYAIEGGVEPGFSFSKAIEALDVR